MDVSFHNTRAIDVQKPEKKLQLVQDLKQQKLILDTCIETSSSSPGIL